VRFGGIVMLDGGLRWIIYNLPLDRAIRHDRDRKRKA
jgi:hypothetical protein